MARFGELFLSAALALSSSVVNAQKVEPIRESVCKQVGGTLERDGTCGYSGVGDTIHIVGPQTPQGCLIETFQDNKSSIVYPKILSCNAFLDGIHTMKSRSKPTAPYIDKNLQEPVVKYDNGNIIVIGNPTGNFTLDFSFGLQLMRLGKIDQSSDRIMKVYLVGENYIKVQYESKPRKNNIEDGGIFVYNRPEKTFRKLD